MWLRRRGPDRLRLIVYVLVVPNLVEKLGRDTCRQSGSALRLLYSHQQFYALPPEGVAKQLA